MIRNENILCLIAMLILGLSGLPVTDFYPAKATKFPCDDMPEEDSLILKG